MPAMPLPPAMQSTCLPRPGRKVACPRGAKTPRGVPSTPSPKTRPLTSRALHVPQVPVPHSYGSSRSLRRPAWRIFSPGSHSNSPAPLRAVTTIFTAASDRLVARDLDPAHDPPEAPGVVDGEVFHAPVVPERDRTLGPTEAAGGLGPVAATRRRKA